MFRILTKVLERGRLMAYLEPSTRYIPYTERRDGAWWHFTLADEPYPQSYLDLAWWLGHGLEVAGVLLVVAARMISIGGSTSARMTNSRLWSTWSWPSRSLP